jgi:hypothetical protein
VCAIIGRLSESKLSCGADEVDGVCNILYQARGPGRAASICSGYTNTGARGAHRHPFGRLLLISVGEINNRIRFHRNGCRGRERKPSL